MDANTQIANDLYLLTSPIRFLFRCVLALLFLLAAPLIFSVVPFLCISLDPNSDFRMLALAYMAFAPFASSFWLLIVSVMPEVYRAQKEGRVFEANHFKGFGLMFIGFFGSIGAEALFLFIFSRFRVRPLTSLQTPQTGVLGLLAWGSRGSCPSSCCWAGG